MHRLRSHIFCATSLLLCTAQVAYAEQPAPMAIAVIALDGSEDVGEDARAACERSDKLELITPLARRSLIEATHAANASPDPKLASVMVEQGLETLLVIAPVKDHSSHTITAFGPRGQVHSQTTFTLSRETPGYRAALEETLQRALATTAPHVLSERKRRPRPTPPTVAKTPPAPSPGEAPRTEANPAKQPIDTAKPPTPQPNTTRPQVANTSKRVSPAPRAKATTEEAAPVTASSRDVKSAESGSDLVFPSVILTGGIGSMAYRARLSQFGFGADDGEVDFRVLALNVNADWHTRFDNGGALELNFSSNYGQDNDIESYRLRFSPREPTPFEQSEATRTRVARGALDGKLSLPSKSRLKLGPMLGAEYQRVSFQDGDAIANLLTGKIGLALHLDFSRVLLDLAFGSQLGRLAWLDDSFSSGVSLQPGATFRINDSKVAVRTGLRLSYHASTRVEAEVFGELSEFTQRLLLAEVAIGYAR